MSASREKRKRAQIKASGKGANKGSGGGAIAVRIIASIVGAAAVLGLAWLILLGQGIPQRYITVSTVEGVPLTSAEINYQVVRTFADYAPMFGDSVAQYASYIQEWALENIETTIHWANAAEAEGMTLTDEDEYILEEALKSFTDTAAGRGMTEQELITSVYGRGVTKDLMVKMMRRELLSQRYQTAHRESFSYTERQIADYYAGNKKDFDIADYRIAAFTKSDYVTDEEREAQSAVGVDIDADLVKVDLVDEEITLAEKYAYDIAEKFYAQELTAENFNELAEAALKTGDDPGDETSEEDEPSDATLMTGVTWSDTPVLNWVFDEARQPGDKVLINNDSVFDVIMFLGRERTDDNTVTFRTFDAETVAEAEEILLDKLTGAPETRFVEVLKETAGVSAYAKYNGGLNKEYSPSKTATGVDEWLRDPERKAGDVTCINNSLLYFIGTVRPAWQYKTEEKMRGDDFTAFTEQNPAKTGEMTVSGLGRLLLNS